MAYFSSVVLFSLAATKSPSQGGYADTSTYFDSVVFLTMFILIGMPCGYYNKRHTGLSAQADTWKHIARAAQGTPLPVYQV